MYSPRDVLSVAIEAVTTETAIVAAPGAGKKIAVLGWCLSLDTAGEIVLESDNGASSDTVLVGAMELAADTPCVVPITGYHVALCNTNEELYLTATTACNGILWYAIVPA